MKGSAQKIIDLIPGTTVALPAIEAGALDKEQFWSEFVSQHRPVVIKNAAAHWPALQTWCAPGYLESLCGDEQVGISRTFNALPAKLYFERVIKKGKLIDCLGEMRRAPDDATYSIPTTAMPAAWERDLGNYAFLDEQYNLPPRFFQRRRLFIYKNASTEWHYHPTDETLMTQIVGAKRVALFRLTPENWSAYAPPIDANLHHTVGGQHYFPATEALTKHEAVLAAGDALYIPPFWWHGIDSADPGCGFTLAHCFRTPMQRVGDFAEPAIRAALAQAFQSHKAMFAYFLAMVTASTLCRLAVRKKW